MLVRRFVGSLCALNVYWIMVPPSWGPKDKHTNRANAAKNNFTRRRLSAVPTCALVLLANNTAHEHVHMYTYVHFILYYYI